MSTPSNPSRSPQVAQLAYSPRSPPIQEFEDPPEPGDYDQQPPEDGAPEDEIPYPEPSSEQTLLPPPNFRPFFALIEDTTSGEHYHPYVHYIFADDDPILVTAASMRSLGLDDAKFLPQDPVRDEEREHGSGHRDDDDDDDVAASVESPLPPPIPGVKEHYLVIDVGPDGRTIENAHSLTPEWQVTNTTMRTAPSFDESSPDQGFMLKVDGITIPGRNKGKGKAQQGQQGQDKLKVARDKSSGDIFQALDDLVQSIDGSMGIAGSILGTNAKEPSQDVVPETSVEEGNT